MRQEDNDKELKIGEVSKLSEIGIEALRFYERTGLIDLPTRSANGYRLYSDAVLRRLEFIKRAQTLGFTLAEIKRVIDDARKGKSPCDEVRQIVHERLTELDKRLREMHDYRVELAKMVADWDRVGRAPGHICGLIEGAQIRHKPSQPSHIKKSRPRQTVRNKRA